MLKERLDLGSVPAEEICQQVGTKAYDPQQAKEECRRYIRQLIAQFGYGPDGVRLIITSNPHDFGTYYEVAVSFDPDREDHWAYASKCESEAWTEWRVPAEIDPTCVFCESGEPHEH